ncbi:MAG: peptidoglycan-binding protein [Patescibacteria group bacterium]|nr:peptidoglycan-binding protein [Patescibacteria group bacterium]
MKNKKIRKIVASFLLTAFAFVSLNNIAFAAYGEQEESTYPYNQTFKITAYYSPLEGQERYVTGSYESDIRLNGRGTNGADGTPVYPGMIAAPKTYPFGLKLRIPGIGTVAVHDRGGAIVHAGEKNQDYDRLDVWMGYGDKGLDRALNWGARVVEAAVLGVDDEIQESVYLEGFEEAEKFIRSVYAKPKLFTHDIWYGAEGDDVKKLQEFLTQLGFFDDAVTGKYGESTKEAVLAFQLEFGVVDTLEDLGAGHFGPRTRLKIEAVWEKRKESQVNKVHLSAGSLGDDVKLLQEALKKLGYSVEVTGEYDQRTVDAVFKFQLDNKIINSNRDLGAGYFGPQTFTLLAKRLSMVDAGDLTVSYVEDNSEYSLLTFNLAYGDHGPAVYKLQSELKALNFLRAEPTGYFGKLTEHAVYKFQQYKGLVADLSSTGAGVFGPLTRSKVNEVLAARSYTNRLIAEKRGDALVAVVEVEEKESVFVADLGFGDKSESVKTLQETLKKLGYFDGVITTEYFGQQTANALLAFQLENEIISSTDEIGAGRLGPSTRAKLNELI